MENKIQEEPLFVPAPFFMVRAPLLPIEDFFSFLQKKNVDSTLFSRFIDDQLVREAIAIASPTLYKALIEKKETSQTAASLFKYLNRMCSRSTPFGLFSCVSMGSWGEKASAVLDFENLYKRARPDMEWLSLIIEQLCKDPSITPSLSVVRNSLLFESGGRIYLEYIRGKKDLEKRKKIASVQLTFLTKAIFELTEKPISVEELKEKLIHRFPSLEKNKLQGVIEKLLHEQFLDYNLRPSLLSESPFDEFLSKVTSISLTQPFYEISERIKIYNQTSIGLGEAQLEETQAVMKGLGSSPYFLQVDAGCTGRNIVLPKIVMDELQNSTEFLWKIACLEPAGTPLKSYHEKFVDKYGNFRLVPLFELLTEEGGLGIPEGYVNPDLEKPLSIPKTRWNEWLQRQWAISIREKHKEIEINDKDLEEIGAEKPFRETAPLSFDLRCEIITDSAEEINKGNFLLQIEPFSWQGGATFGRFVDMLGNEAKDKLQAFYQEEEALDKGCLFLESSYHHPNFLRSANVMIQPNLRSHCIDLGGRQGTISLDQIYVGATKDRLYVTLNDGIKELRITSNNMLNPINAPIPLRFIRDISNSKYRLLYPFSWKELTNTFFLPRIRYKKTIIIPSQWKVDLFQLGSTLKEPLEMIEKLFSQWADAWQLPRYIMMADEDNRLLLDRQHPLHLREIAQEIKKGEKIHLIEKIGQTEKGLIQSQKGTHYGEFIIPFLKNKKYSAPINNFPMMKHQPLLPHSRWKLPGSDWLYVKFYLGKENENRFLIEQCTHYANSFLNKGIISGWFFVRYADPKIHLRIRFHGEKEQILSKLLPEIHEWATTLIHKRMISELNFATYEREVERYGGVELIESTEALFCADTQTAMHIICAMEEKKTLLAEEVVAALSFIDLLRGLGLNIKEQVSFFSSLGMKKEDLSGFRKWKTSLLSVSQAIFDEGLEIKNESLFLHQAFQKRKNTLRDYAKTIQEVKEQQKLALSTFSIYDSLLHMHFNRLIGRSGKEMKARLYAYHTLIVLEEQEKRKSQLRFQVLL